MREQTAMRRECFSIGAIPSEKTCHLLAQLTDLLLQGRSRGNPTNKMLALATRGITKGRLDCCWMQEELNNQLVLVSNRQFQL